MVVWRSFPSLLLPLVIVIVMNPIIVLGQPEPPTPEEEWSPPPPVTPVAMSYEMISSGTGMPAAPGSVSIKIVDESGRARREQYGSERFCLEMVTPYSNFYIFLYEWYPPGSFPQGHWLIFGAGPYNMWQNAIVKICYFIPEVGEPEGQHTWKLWLYDPFSRSWSTGIYRFNYYAFPRAVIERVEYPPEIFVRGSYDLRVTVRNLGEVDYEYRLYAEVSGASLDRTEESVRVPASSTATVTFRFSVLSGSPKIDLRLLGGGRVLESRSVTLAARVQTPGPMTLGDVAPRVLKEGQETQLSVTFVNQGQGKAERVFAKIEAPGFQVISGLESLPNIEGGATGRAIFNVKPVEGGSKTIRVILEYSDALGNKYSNTIESTLTVLTRLQVYSVSEEGSELDIPVVVNGREYRKFDDWVDPSEKVSLEVHKEVPWGFGVKQVFDHWEDEEGKEISKSASYKLIVTRSSTIKAVWRVDYTGLIQIALLAAVIVIIPVALLLIRVRKRRISQQGLSQPS